MPAYNEAGAGRRAWCVRLRERAPSFDVIVVDDGSTDDTAERARAAGADRGQAAVQPRHRRRRADRLRVRARARLRLHGPGRRRRPARARRARHPARRDRRRTRASTWSAARAFSAPTPATRRRSAAAPGSTCSPSRCSKILGQPVTDPTSGFRLYNRRAIRLFARDYPHDYPEVEAVLMLHAHRLRMAEVPVRMHLRGSGRSSITKPPLGVLHDQGVAGAARRPDAPPRRRSSRATRRRSRRHGGSEHAHRRSARLDRLRGDRVRAGVRDGAPPLPARALRDPVAGRGAGAARAGGLDRAADAPSPARWASPRRPTPSS